MMRMRVQGNRKPITLLARAAGGLFLALALAGCINLGLGGSKDAPPVTYYVLDDLGRAAPTPAHVQKNLTLVVLDAQATAYYDTDGIAYSDSDGTRSYYHYARWTERPGKRFTDLLTLRLDRDKLFRAVVADGQVKGDWLLETELLEIYHDAVHAPGKARIVLRAQVVDLTSHALVGQKLFDVGEDLSSFDAAGAHQGLDRATTRLLDQLMDWLASLPGN